MGSVAFAVDTGDKFAPLVVKAGIGSEFDLRLLDSDVPRAYIVKATPRLIDELLRRNVNNRRISRNNIEKLRRDIRNGGYVLTSAGIGVAKSGHLTNGQHRAEAIRLEGYPPVDVLLVVGLEKKSQVKEDIGARRNLEQSMALGIGIKADKGVVAAARLLLGSGALFRRVEFKYNLAGVSNTEIEKFIVDAYDELHDVISACKSKKAPLIAALFVYFCHDRKGALEFAQQLGTGENIQSTDPAYRLRNAIYSSDKYKSRGGSEVLSLFRLAVTAVVAHAKQQSIGRLCESPSWNNAPWKIWRADTYLSKLTHNEQ